MIDAVIYGMIPRPNSVLRSILPPVKSADTPPLAEERSASLLLQQLHRA
jgi:hypothetical protein